MRPSSLILSTLFSVVEAAGQLSSASTCGPLPSNSSSNIWKTHRLNPNPQYRKLVLEAAARIEDDGLRRKALKVADTGSFIWVKNSSDLSVVEEAAASAPCNHIIGVALHGMHNSDCTSPRFQPMNLETYRSSYIDPLENVLRRYPEIFFVVIVEPEVLATVVVNMDIQSCRPLATSYNTNTAYALRALSLPNVWAYIDAGHGGWLGWDANLKPAATYLANVYKNAGSPSQVRGFAVNIGGWNSWDLQPGEFVTTREGPRNRAQNEKTYITLLGELLRQAGVPNHAIMDTSRNGIHGLRQDWTEWCNVNGAGFGKPPTPDTGLDLADAFIWAKGGGLSDGTSDPSSPNYNSFCGKPTAFAPSPEQGEWNQAYFEMLLQNANPPIIN